jgi:hypothetical protein
MVYKHSNLYSSWSVIRSWHLLALIGLAISVLVFPDQIDGYPPAGQVPPVESSFLDGVDLSRVPKVSLNSGQPPTCNGATGADVCWWTCSGCHRSNDAVSCPGKYLALTFDDGP